MWVVGVVGERLMRQGPPLPRTTSPTEEIDPPDRNRRRVMQFSRNEVQRVFAGVVETSGLNEVSNRLLSH